MIEGLQSTSYSDSEPRDDTPHTEDEIASPISASTSMPPSEAVNDGTAQALRLVHAGKILGRYPLASIPRQRDERPGRSGFKPY